MKKIFVFIQRNWYVICVILILVIAVFLRFYNYENRWGIAYDQAHDALVARHAVAERKIPLLGPFSSAGPFQTGGEWYWLLMIPTALYPYSVLSPWIFMTALYVVFVVVMIIVGTKLEGKKFGLISGMLAAVSTAQIAQGVSLTNQTPQSIFALLAILFMVKFIQEKKPRLLFFMSLCIGLAASIHLQGAVLVLFLVATIILTRTFKVNHIALAAFGLLIPILPIFLYDVWHDFFNIRNMFQYYLYDQYKISLDVLGRRWLTFAGDFIPRVWSNIIGGLLPAGFLQIIGIVTVSVYLGLNKKLKKEWIILLVSTVGMITILRYTRILLFDSYLVFLHPFILLLSGFFIMKTFTLNRVLGLVVFLGIVALTVTQDIPHLKGGYNYTAHIVSLQKKALFDRYPNTQFAVYDHGYRQKDKSLPLALFLDVEGKISDNGHKIGVYIQTTQYRVDIPVMLGEKGEYQLVDLEGFSSFDLSRDQWALVNPSEIYRTTEEWYTKK